MNLRNFSWHDNSKKIPKDSHAIFGASNYHWINYSEEKMLQMFVNQQQKRVGTELHETAAMLIKHKIKLPETNQTLNMYVNDAIFFGMIPEQKLYYSKYFYGTADAIKVDSDILRIHDLKTGKTKASMKQLLVYTAFYLLEYGLIPTDFKNIELRLYQNSEVETMNPGVDDIVPIMDKVIVMTEMLTKTEEAENYG